jgi:hypothetical protein
MLLDLRWHHASLPTAIENHFHDSDDRKRRPQYFKAVPKSRRKQKKDERRQQDGASSGYMLIAIYSGVYIPPFLLYPSLHFHAREQS